MLRSNDARACVPHAHELCGHFYNFSQLTHNSGNQWSNSLYVLLEHFLFAKKRLRVCKKKQFSSVCESSHARVANHLKWCFLDLMAYMYKDSKPEVSWIENKMLQFFFGLIIYSVM